MAGLFPQRFGVSRSEWGPIICISTSSQVLLLLLVRGSQCENHHSSVCEYIYPPYPVFSINMLFYTFDFSLKWLILEIVPYMLSQICFIPLTGAVVFHCLEYRRSVWLFLVFWYYKPCYCEMSFSIATSLHLCTLLYQTVYTFREWMLNCPPNRFLPI